jgi:hypothetical protein
LHVHQVEDEWFYVIDVRVGDDPLMTKEEGSVPVGGRGPDPSWCLQSRIFNHFPLSEKWRSLVGEFTYNPCFTGTWSRLYFPNWVPSVNYLPVSELASFSSHEICVIWKVISCPLTAS